MKLLALVPHLSQCPDIDIQSLALDSRAVQPGTLFAALPGHKAEGSAFIDQAIAKGAVAVLCAPEHVRNTIFCIADTNPRQRLADMAARFYGKQPEKCVAVTGTNGKTSVVEMCRQLWQKLGLSAASIGTLGIHFGDAVVDTGMTSPDVLTFQRCLADLQAQGCSRAAFEASSHALDQYRVAGAEIVAAGFTNLSRDHLDYHGSMENYGAAKARLFSEMLPTNGVGVINMDDPFAPELVKICTVRDIAMLRYGVAGVELKLLARETLMQGQHLRLLYKGTRTDIVLPLVGAFQAANALCALALVMASGADAHLAIQALGQLTPIAGRLEYIGLTSAGASVYVDYAHTPDGLQAALMALRPHTPHKLSVVFGCGGDRDRGKRPEMGKIAATLADTAIITDDNPRTENAEQIRAEVADGAPQARVIGDRAQAIALALATAGAGDSVLVAGKGHETGQIIGTTVHPFDDRAVVRAWLAGQAA